MKIVVLIENGRLSQAFATEKNVSIDVIYADDDDIDMMDRFEKIQNEMNVASIDEVAA